MWPDSKVQKKHKVWVTINKHISFPPESFLLLFITFQLESLRFDWNISRHCFASVAAAHQPLSPLWLRRALQSKFLFTGQITLTGPVWSINYKSKLIRKHHICYERGTARLALSRALIYSHFTSLRWYPSLDNGRFVFYLLTGWLHVHRHRCKHRLPQRVWYVVGAAASGPEFLLQCNEPAKTALTVWYFPDLEIRLKHLRGILVPSTKGRVQRWEEKSKQVEGWFKWRGTKLLVFWWKNPS